MPKERSTRRRQEATDNDSERTKGPAFQTLIRSVSWVCRRALLGTAAPIANTLEPKWVPRTLGGIRQSLSVSRSSTKLRGGRVILFHIKTFPPKGEPFKLGSISDAEPPPGTDGSDGNPHVRFRLAPLICTTLHING